MDKFDIALIDWPWSFETYSVKGLGRSPTYPKLKISDAPSIQLESIMNDNYALFFWVTQPHLLISPNIMFKSWGCSYRTKAWTWLKTTKDGKSVRMMKGYYTRKTTEDCLLAVRGKMPVKDRSVSDIIISPWKAESKKPYEQYQKIESLYPNCNYIELFAREKRDGWTSLGNEIDGLDIRDSIKNIMLLQS